MQLLLLDNYLRHKTEYGGIWKEDPLCMPCTAVSLSEEPILPFPKVHKKCYSSYLDKQGQPEELCLTLAFKAHSLVTELDQRTQSLLIYKIKNQTKPSLEWGQHYNDAASLHTAF